MNKAIIYLPILLGLPQYHHPYSSYIQEHGVAGQSDTEPDQADASVTIEQFSCHKC